MVTICSLVARAGGTEDEQVQNMADRMVDYARQCMRSRTRVSPFERAFLKLHSLLLFIVRCTLAIGLRCGRERRELTHFAPPKM